VEHAASGGRSGRKTDFRGRNGGVYLRPVSGCIRPWCVLGVTFALAGCFGLLTLVLLLANSSRMVCGMSGSNRTPCCRNRTHNNGYTVLAVGAVPSENRSDELRTSRTNAYASSTVAARVRTPRAIGFVRWRSNDSLVNEWRGQE